MEPDRFANILFAFGVYRSIMARGIMSFSVAAAEDAVATV